MYSQSMFCAKISKISNIFNLENQFVCFFTTKNLCILHGQVFVMTTIIRARLPSIRNKRRYLELKCNLLNNKAVSVNSKALQQIVFSLNFISINAIIITHTHTASILQSSETHRYLIFLKRGRLSLNANAFNFSLDYLFAVLKSFRSFENTRLVKKLMSSPK